MIVLENNKVKVSFNLLGAELCSFFNKKNNKEYLWQADETVWARHAPILFPIVGKLPENTYIVDGKSYTLTQHGFARDSKFECVNCTSTELVLLLRSNEKSLQIYPYQFELFVKYTLKETKLTVEYQVHNIDNNEIYFSIGAHPGFNCPIDNSLKFEDYYLDFSANDAIERYLLKNGLLSSETERIELNYKTLQLSQSLFDNDAIVLKNLKSDSITLKNTKNTDFVKLEAVKFPFYGIWSKPKTNQFICLEPWYGITSSSTVSTELKDKEGIIKLGIKERFNCEYSIEVG